MTLPCLVNKYIHIVAALMHCLSGSMLSTSSNLPKRITNARYCPDVQRIARDSELPQKRGEGAGEVYIPGRSLRKLDKCAAAFLMGCSSGKLSGRGDYEPCGIPLSYLMAGCPTAVANLWDVTDGDIDRFSRSVLEKWLEGVSTSISREAAAESQAQGRRDGVMAKLAARLTLSPSDSSVLKPTPRDRCRVAQTGCIGALELEQTEGGGKYACLTLGVLAGRRMCRLQHLIGASPVCYGVPTYIAPSHSCRPALGSPKQHEQKFHTGTFSSD